MTYPSLSNISTFQDLAYHLRDVTAGLFWFLLPLSLSSIIIIIGIIMERRLSFTCAVACFVFGILSMLLSFANLLNPVFAIGGFIFTGLCMLWNKFDNQ